ncbi:hypothetical protein TcasGA2_TC011327 [Tribolium castaneum]|uniref:Uncharacterized protein n=1 Tax=Tribolium castaneum TaxID=7070 RepID=D6X400_TRICA|nr:hypothetical protein TcasGA2_TC011327 [Tribolium castaneum]
MNNLMEKLRQLQKRASPTEPKKAASTRKRKPACDKSPKITSWLNKENKGESKRAQKKQPEQLDVTVKKKKSLQRSFSFEKYGVSVPSFEKIVTDQKNFDQYRRSVEQLDVFDEDILQKNLGIDSLKEDNFMEELLDCKHLTSKDLKKAFERHKDTLDAIMEGRKYSDRHRAFHQSGNNISSAKSLFCSNSVIVFSEQQKEVLLDLMKSEFDQEDKMDSYFFKVLLPELCLIIFMEEHKMSKRSANEYLNKRPLDI